MANFVSALMLAAASGLAVVAIRYPGLYPRVGLAIAETIALVYVAVFAWDVAVAEAFQAFRGLLPDEKVAEAASIERSLAASQRVFLLLVGAWAYLGFLFWLSTNVARFDKESG